VLCSIAIAAFVYFVIVRPETDTVNRSLQQAQQDRGLQQQVGLSRG
jgi:hypothetical protein